MKVVTEFANFTLNKALQTKTALAGEGKSPEEIQQSLGEAFKLEGEKLGYLMTAIDIASQNKEGLKRVLVMSLNEGEKPPAKASKVEEMYFVPEMHIERQAKQPHKDEGKGGRHGRGGKGGKGGGKGGGRGGDQKSSPWGLSPEEKAAKAAKGQGAKPAKPQ